MVKHDDAMILSFEDYLTSNIIRKGNCEFQTCHFILLPRTQYSAFIHRYISFAQAESQRLRNHEVTLQISKYSFDSDLRENSLFFCLIGISCLIQLIESCIFGGVLKCLEMFRDIS